MSEKLLRIMLSEIDTMRFQCVKCETAFEFPMRNLDKAFIVDEGNGKKWQCPHCHETVCGVNSGKSLGNPFSEFLTAINRLKDLEEAMTIQFVLPAKDE